MSIVTKTRLAATAAALMLTTGAQAADLGVVEPVEYVKVCDAYGAGYFYIPGTQTCLKVGGYMRSEYRYNQPLGGDETHLINNRNTANLTTFYNRGLVNFDARTDTEFGLLRSFVAIYLDSDNGPELDKGYIQFGGLTAGHAASFYEFLYDDLYIAPFYSDDTVDLIAYTASLGNGITATISLEDYYDRYLTTTSAALPTSVGYGGAAGDPYGYVTKLTPAGKVMPDVVGNVRVDQGWGSFAVSGAIHQVRPQWGSGPAPDGNGLANTLYQADSEYGFALQAGIKVNLPQIAKGDFIYVVGGYTSGAIDYVRGDLSLTPLAGGNGYASGGIVDAVVTPAGDVELTDAWAINVGFLHYWTPSLRSSGVVSYLSIDQGFTTGVLADGRTGNGDVDVLLAAANLIWTPVKGLDIGVEAVYQNYDFDAADVATDDIWSGRVRIQRNF